MFFYIFSLLLFTLYLYICFMKTILLILLLGTILASCTKSALVEPKEKSCAVATLPVYKVTKKKLVELPFRQQKTNGLVDVNQLDRSFYTDLDTTSMQWEVFQMVDDSVAKYNLWADKINTTFPKLQPGTLAYDVYNKLVQNIDPSFFGANTAKADSLAGVISNLVNISDSSGVAEYKLSREALMNNLYDVEIVIDPSTSDDPQFKPARPRRPYAAYNSTQDCGCNHTIDFCPVGMDCGDPCRKGGETTHGCGLFWVMKCNNNCGI